MAPPRSFVRRDEKKPHAKDRIHIVNPKPPFQSNTIPYGEPASKLEWSWFVGWNVCFQNVERNFDLAEHVAPTRSFVRRDEKKPHAQDRTRTLQPKFRFLNNALL